MKLTSLVLILFSLCAAPLFADEQKDPLPLPTTSDGWVDVYNLEDIKALPTDTKHVHVHDATNEMLTALNRLTGVESLTVGGTYDDDGAKELGRLRSLRDLQLNCSLLTDKCLPEIGKLTNLEWLGFERCHQFTDKGFKHLTELDKVTWLIIHGDYFVQMPKFNNGLTDMAAKSLVKMNSLERLDIGHCAKFGDRGVGELAEKCDNLRDVTFNSLQEVTDKGMRSLAGCRTLEKLTLMQCNGVGEKAWAYFTKHGALRELSVEGGQPMGNTGLEALAKAPALERLKVSKFAAMTGMPPDMGGMPGEEEDQVEITDAGLKALAGSESLTSLILFAADAITAEGVAHLAGLQLTELGLSYCKGIGDDALVHVGKFKSLKKLHLSNINYGPPGMDMPGERAKVSDKGLAEIAKLADLTELDLSGRNHITDAGAKLLGELKGLEKLYIYSCQQISESTAEELRERLPNCQVTSKTPGPG